MRRVAGTERWKITEGTRRSALAVSLSLRVRGRETPRIAEGRREGEGTGTSATRARSGRGRRTIRKGQESSSDTRTTATLRGHSQSARETSSTSRKGHASIAPVNGAPLARLVDHENLATGFFDPRS